jgi:hypothetical protein
MVPPVVACAGKEPAQNVLENKPFGAFLEIYESRKAIGMWRGASSQIRKNPPVSAARS